MGSVRIPLHSRKYPNLYAIIDEEDLPLVSQYRWCVYVKPHTTYAVAYREHDNSLQTIRMHRLIMGDPPGLDIDHRNRNGLDNRKENLRAATRTQNMQNQRRHRNSRYPYKGIARDKSGRYWRAAIYVNGRRKDIGRFATPEEAARAYDEAAVRYFGEFARTNFNVQMRIF